MRYRRLGKTGLEVSVVGFGGIPIQRISTEETEKVVDRSVELGINFFDTARGYTDSEEKLGVVLEKHRDKVLIATKSMARDREGMAADIEKSLKTMAVDHIELYQLHNIKDQETFDQVMAPDGALAALKDAKEKGLIGHIGVTGHIKEFLLKIMESGEVETVQFPFNPVETNGVREIIDLAEKMDIGTIVMKPLAGGAITDADLALRYLFEHGVTTAIPGMDTVLQVEENATAGRDCSPLSGEERDKLLDETDKLGTSFCRRCEYCLPCPQGIPIPAIFLFEGYYTRYGLKDWSKERYLAMETGPSACVECGICESRCPYDLPIREMLKNAAKRMCG